MSLISLICRSASIKSHVYDGFLPVRTLSKSETAAFLAHVTGHLARRVAAVGLGCNTVLLSQVRSKRLST